MQLVPENGDSPLRSVLRGREHLAEPVAGHSACVPTAACCDSSGCRARGKPSGEFGPRPCEPAALSSNGATERTICLRSTGNIALPVIAHYVAPVLTIGSADSGSTR